MATYQERMTKLSSDAMLSAAIALGGKLSLFDALAAVGSEEKPATAAEVAQHAKCKTRYVAEWLAVMACGNVIEVTPDEKYYIQKDNVACVTGPTVTNGFAFLPCLLKGFERLAVVFKDDDVPGMDYSNFADFYKLMDHVSESLHREHLISDFVPLLGEDIPERLTKGDVQLLDVGCGAGFHATFLAEHYPKAQFTGIDITPAAIASAKERKNETTGEPLTNVKFFVHDARSLDAEWTNKFDVVTIFDACHDQQRPDLCLKEVYRVLKPGGVLGMLEIKGSSNVFEDKRDLGPLAEELYKISLFHCLPVGSNSKDALCLGTMWGQKRAQKLLADAGFKEIKVIPTPMFAINTLFVCRK